MEYGYTEHGRKTLAAYFKVPSSEISKALFGYEVDVPIYVEAPQEARRNLREFSGWGRPLNFR